MEANPHTPPAGEWPARFRFHQPCGCGMHIGAETTGRALLMLIGEYEARETHAHQGPVITGKLLKYPEIQVATVDFNYITESVKWTFGGPLFPCGGWNLACARCGETFHADLPGDHPNPPGGCAGHSHVCDECAARHAS